MEYLEDNEDRLSVAERVNEPAVSQLEVEKSFKKKFGYKWSIFVKTNIMQTIRLRVNDKIYDRFMWFLKRFNKEEIQVIRENDEFVSVREYLTKELEKIENGTAKFLTIDELDSDLEITIKKHEA